MPLARYESTFTIAGIAFGFDVRTSSYSEDASANVTIRPVPYAQNYMIVVQTGGSMPVTRSYRALVYSETDYLNLRGQRGAIGQLLTPREPVQTAILTDCKRADMQDPGGIDMGIATGTGVETGFVSPSGIQTIELTFTMLTLT